MVSPGTLIKQNTLGRESPVLPELPDAASPCIHQNHHIHLSFGVWSHTSHNTIEDAHGFKTRPKKHVLLQSGCQNELILTIIVVISISEYIWMFARPGYKH